jgi:hypothetical protein
LILSFMPRSAMAEESDGSNARATLVRSMYEIVYMIKATGMMRSQRCWGTVGTGLPLSVASSPPTCRYNSLGEIPALTRAPEASLLRVV